MDSTTNKQTHEYEAQPKLALQCDIDGSGYVHLSSFVVCDTPKDIPIIWTHQTTKGAEIEIIKNRRISTATPWKFSKKQKAVGSKRSQKEAIRRARDEKYGFIESQALFPPIKVEIEASAEIKDMVEGFKNQLQETFGYLSGRVIDSTDTIRDSLSATLQTVSGHINSFIDAAKNIFWLIPVIGLVCYVATQPKKTALATALIGVIALLIPSPLKPIMDRAMEYIRGAEIQSQAGFFDGKGIMTIVSFGTALMALGGSLKHLNMVDNLSEIASKVNFDISKRTSFITTTLTVIEDTINVVLKMFGKEKMCLLRSGQKEVDSWCDRVSMVTRNFTLCESKISNDEVQCLRGLRYEALELEKAYRMDRVAGPILRNYLAQLDNICRANVAAFNAHDSVRPEPVCFALYGKPGNGKTIMCNVLSRVVMAKTMSPERIKAIKGDFKREMYQQGASEYWNGYCGQYTYIKDDCFQQVDATGATDSDAMDIIKAVNTWMYPLNMADLENKGKHNFSSRFIMLTTNVGNLAVSVKKVVADHNAVVRRLHHPYALVVSDEFCKQGMSGTEASALDTRKLAKFIEEKGTIPTDAWKFAPFNFNTGKVDLNKPLVDFKEMVELLSFDLRAREAQHVGVEKPIGDLVSSILAEREIDIHSQAGESLDPAILEPGFMSNAQKASFCISGEKPSTRMEKLKEGLEEVRRTMKDALWNPVKFAERNPIISTLLGLTSLGVFFALARFALSSLCKHLFGKEEVMESQVIDYKTLKDLSVKRDLPTDVQNSVSKNLFHVTVVDETAGWQIPLGSAVAVVGKTFALPHHFITLMREMEQSTKKTVVHFRNVHNPEFNVEFPFNSFLKYECIEQPNEDVCFMRLPVNMACTDIVSKFISEVDLHKLKKFDVMLACARPIPHSVTRAMMFGQAKRHDHYTVDSGKRSVTRGYQYNIATDKGDCGGLVMVGSSVTYTGGRKITGFHSAGAPHMGLGFSTIVTKDMIDKALEQFKEIRDTDVPHDLVDQCDSFPVKGSFIPLYSVKKQTTMPPNSKLFKTPLYGSWCENTRFPAHLRSFFNEQGEEVIPMMQALKNYSTPVRIYDTDDIEDCAWVAWKCVTDSTKDIDRKVYTFEEACKGDETNKLFRSVPRRTSAGYPFSCYGASGKTDFFGKGEEFDLENENCQWLRSYVDEIVDNARNRKRMFHVFNDFLKDERRTKEKNALGKTRLVSGAPLGYVIAFRQYFGCFCSALMEKRIESGCAAGVNVYTEWGVVRDYLMNKSPHVIAGDYSAFDSSEQPQVHDAILRYINKWYDDGEENATIREVLWLDLVHSRHIGGDGKQNNIVYQWHHSLPSGHPGTTAINSLYNLFNFALCWKKIMGPERLGDFNKNVRIIVLGDDNVVAIKQDVLKEYNQHSITIAMSEIYMTYTTEAKDGAYVEPYRSIDQVTFLKREWRDENGYVFGPLAMESILEMPFWCRDKLCVEEITQSNFETALMELSAHRQEVWDEWLPKMLQAYEAIGYETAVRPVRRNYQAKYKAMNMDYY